MQNLTLHLESRLNKAIYQDHQESVESRDKELPCGPRNLLKMSRWYRRRLDNLRTCFGEIGMGDTRLFATTEDDQEYELSPVNDTHEARNVIAQLTAQVEQVAAVPN